MAVARLFVFSQHLRVVVSFYFLRFEPSYLFQIHSRCLSTNTLTLFIPLNGKLEPRSLSTTQNWWNLLSQRAQTFEGIQTSMSMYMFHVPYIAVKIVRLFVGWLRWMARTVDPLLKPNILGMDNGIMMGIKICLDFAPNS